MMIRKWFLLLAAIGFVLSLSSCNEPLPTCATEDLDAPVLGDPPMWGMVDSLTPTLAWSYPDSSCNPQGYAIHLHTGPFFTDNLGGGTGNPSTLWSPAVPLQPGTEYTWAVQAINGTTLGPYAGDHYFFTGPICETASLKAPTLLEPVNGDIANDLEPTLIWDYPDPCVPEGYRVDLSTDPTFADTSLSGGTGNPSTRWGPGDPLVDCTRYYWRIAPINDTTLGPFSGAFTFRVETSACAPETTGMIMGKVWHDLCALPELGPVPDPLPLGCAWVGDGISANGIYEPGEPGIGNVVVRLGSGSCPSIDRGAILTQANGNFTFYELRAGTYCVSIDALEENNVSTLIPGGWTFPAGGVGGQPANWDVMVGTGDTVTDVNFGWDYQFAPGYGEYGSISGIVWHDECSVPPDTSPVPDPLPEGCVVDEAGVVHADGIRQPDEPGIEGVVVDIGPGECPSSGLAEASTDADGQYTFVGLSAANYCLRIDAEGFPNDTILLPGRWTMVLGGHMGMTFRAITLVAGESLADQDFGWDYDNLPLASSPTFKLNMNANCRVGPSQLYDLVTALPAGLVLPVDGQNTDSTWVHVIPPQDRPCWLSQVTGYLTGDLTQEPLISAPPLPTMTQEPLIDVLPQPTTTFTPIPACSAYNTSDACKTAGCVWHTGITNPGGYCDSR